MALKHGNTQPLLIPLNQDTDLDHGRKITVHLAVSDSQIERALLSLLGRKSGFSVVRGQFGYAVEVDVRIVDQVSEHDQQRELDELKQPKLLFIGSSDSETSMLDAAKAGVWSLVTIDVDPPTLVDAIVTLVNSTGSPLLKQLTESDSGCQALLRELSAASSEALDAERVPSPLTNREMQILDLIAGGESSKGVGEIVGLGEQTIKNYVLNILEKTSTRNRAHAAATAMQHGWLHKPDVI